MIEKFSDYEGGFIQEEGKFVFEVTNAELIENSKGNPMVVIECKSDAGTTKLYHNIDPKCRWSYNKLISACLNLSAEEKKTFELDYETVHNQLIGKKFLGDVEASTYVKEVKKPNEDGTFETTEEEKVSYKVVSYAPVE